MAIVVATLSGLPCCGLWSGFLYPSVRSEVIEPAEADITSDCEPNGDLGDIDWQSANSTSGLCKYGSTQANYR